jgi:hypothetical protein
VIFFRIFICAILLPLLLFSGCKKEDEVEDNVTAIENMIRKEFDHYATYSFAQYENMLNVLTDEKFIVLPLNEMRDSVNDSKIIVGLRHDIDCHPFKAIQMAEIEKRFGFRATYFILPTASYYGKFRGSEFIRYDSMADIYEELDSLGAEIGIHNDLISVMIQYNLDPMWFNRVELDFFNSIQIPINGTAAHGSAVVINLNLVNYEIFSDYNEHPKLSYKSKNYYLGKYSLKDFGFQYEAYHVASNIYFSDNGGKFSDGYDGFIAGLKNCKPGDRIQLLTHPVWWGK